VTHTSKTAKIIKGDNTHHHMITSPKCQCAAE